MVVWAWAPGQVQWISPAFQTRLRIRYCVAQPYESLMRPSVACLAWHPHRRKPRPSGPITRRAGLFFPPGLDGQAEASEGAREVIRPEA